jgi:predicted ATP-grasp superfamily ATP-dependent carboligase
VADGAVVGIFGASVRAAAFSALRAGLRPWCADLFVDADLGAACPALRLPGRYPDGFLEVVDRAPPGPWLYTGGLENHPALVGRLAERRPLWGNGPEVLAFVRAPEVLVEAARAAGLPAPEVCRGSPAGPGEWLVKPRRGAGGAGVRFWDGAGSVPAGAYLQRFIEGEPASALYAGTGREARLLGCTRQLVGAGWLHAAPFHYCGSVGPLDVEGEMRRALERLGTELARRCGLVGLFGVDGVIAGGTFWPVEVNPRYPASAEVLEHATGLRALDWHRQACAGGALLTEAPCPGGGQVGKAVLFARAGLTFPGDGPWRGVLRALPPPEVLPPFADLPHVGEWIEAGRPVLTLFARGAGDRECLSTLRQTAAELDRWLHGGAVIG